jgi:uncharacterized protein (TIGR03492 family)
VRVTLLSNGHGEDTVGATLGEALRSLAPELTLQAFPTVDAGEAYERLGVPILGPRRVMPSGGLTVHTLSAFLADLRAGFLSMTVAQVRGLCRLQTDALVVIGDLYALLLSSLVRTTSRFYVQTLVSSYHAGGRSLPNRYFMERFSPPERALMRRLVHHTYVRDAPTAALLARYGLPASALGNPMLDPLTAVSADVDLGVPLTSPVVALLPGTRRYAPAALERMLRALEHWPEATGLVAWAKDALPTLAGWRLEPVGSGWRIVRSAASAGHPPRVYLLQHRFAEVLRVSQLALGTSGTAHEQAAALGLPVVAFALPPDYTLAFLANQERLLGAALTLAAATPAALAEALQRLWRDPERYRRASQAGRARMGAPGGSEAVARDILRRLAEAAPPH